MEWSGASPSSASPSLPPALRFFLCLGSWACISFSSLAASLCASFTRSSRMRTVSSSAGYYLSARGEYNVTFHFIPFYSMPYFRPPPLLLQHEHNLYHCLFIRYFSKRKRERKKERKIHQPLRTNLRELLTDESLQALIRFYVILRHESNAATSFTRPRRPSNPNKKNNCK